MARMGERKCVSFIPMSLLWNPQSPTPQSDSPDTHRLSRQPPRPNLPIVSLEEEDMVKWPRFPALSYTEPVTWPQYLPALHPHQEVQEGPGYQYHPGKWINSSEGPQSPQHTGRH